MILDAIRPQYGICILDPMTERVQTTMMSLRDSGYHPEHFTNYEALLDYLGQNPPHLILFNRSDEQHKIQDLMLELRAILPETHFVVLSTASGVGAVWREWGEFIYDCIMFPPVHTSQLVKAIDRAAERDAWMYRSEGVLQGLQTSPPEKIEATEVVLGDAVRGGVEGGPENSINSFHDKAHSSQFWERQDKDLESSQFLEQVLNQATSGTSKSFVEANALDSTSPELLQKSSCFDLSHYWKDLNQQSQVDTIISTALLHMSEVSSQAQGVFLRYLPHRRCLVISCAHKFSQEQWHGLGLNLIEEAEFKTRDLLNPEKIIGLKEMAQTLVQHERFWTQPFKLGESVYGLFMLFKDEKELDVEGLQILLKMAEDRAHLLESKRHLHSVETRDNATLLLQQGHLVSRLRVEVARARRILRPVSFLIISMDQSKNINEIYGYEELQLTLRALGKIIGTRSRVNDILGRVGSDELGLILPHTPIQGASTKAERLRRLIEAANFSKLLPKIPQLTISVGISEYPGNCRDGDELFSHADDALWQIKNKEKNKICLYSPKPGFEPDFLTPL
ncbi:MAG: GGDEF domain-containing protein [Bdellovibrionales bacterium]|nr:GGDEF domain-containing protein [Bdellovibrionales bacterium]